MERKQDPKQERKGRIAARLCSRRGMTLTEMLAVLLILSMTAVAIGGGVTAVKHAYQKTTQKAEAQQVLATTAELITQELAEARQETDGGTEGPAFLDENGAWIRLVSDPEQGICKRYLDVSEAEGTVPLLSSGAMADIFYTDFDSYSCDGACFTVRDLAVYYRSDAGKADRTPAALLPELTVRAVNLEGRES